MRLEELSALCREAVRDLVGKEQRPLPAAVVLPRPEATRIVVLHDLPADETTRASALDRFVEAEMRPVNAPCYGFMGEAELDSGDGTVEVAMVVFGARQQGAWVTAAPLGPAGLGDFLDDEPLDPHAMPWLVPLQRAVDQAGPPDVTAVR